MKGQTQKPQNKNQKNKNKYGKNKNQRNYKKAPQRVSMTLDELKQTINEYCSKSTKLDEATARSIIEFIKVILPREVNLTYEHLDCLNKFPRFRMILSSRKHEITMYDELVQHANGLVFEVSEVSPEVSPEVSEETSTSTSTSTPPSKISMRYLVIPAKDFSPNRPVILPGTRVYEIQDGTTVNFYYDTYEESWVVSTRRSYDIRETVWRGYTYNQLLEEIFETVDFSYEKLDINKNYTIGFCHPKFHPFKPRVGIWFIQSVDQNNVIDLTSPDLPTQTEIEDADVNQLSANCSEALDLYLAGSEYTLGYIIRNPNGDSFLMESTLLSQIRRLIYQLPQAQNRQIRNKHEQNFKNFDYVVLENYMDFRKRDIFVNIFQQYDQLFSEFDQIVNTTVTNLIQVINRYNEIHQSGAIQKSKLELDFPNDSKSDKLVHVFYFIIKDIITSTPSNKLIRDMIIHPKYTEKVYNILFAE
jgi:hypothetical protein